MKYIEWTLFFVGLIVVIYLIHQTGLSNLWRDVSMVGWGFLFVLLQEMLAHMANTLGWVYTISPDKRTVPFRSLFMYRLAGDGINYLTPTATIGGEFVRARLITPRLGASESASSVTLAKFAETNGQVVFITVGLCFILPFLPGLGIYRWWMFGFLLVAMALIAWLTWMFRKGFYEMSVKVLAFFRLTKVSAVKRWFSKNDENIKEIDSRIRLYTTGHRLRDLIRSVICYTAAFAFSAIEVWIILYLLGLTTSWHVVLGVEVLSVLIEAVLFFVPVKMGTQEGGKVLIFKILALDPSKGLAMGVIRRIREIFWALFGLFFYIILKASNEKTV